MNKQETQVRKPNRWSHYQIEILLFASIVDLLAFLWVKEKPECCDANAYLLEGSNVGRGFIPSSDTTWLNPLHNYLYPAFIHVAQSLGLTTRSGITTLQFLLILASCLFVSIRVSKVLKMSVTQLLGATLLVAFLPILAFSGYLLTEALASSFLILWFGLWLELCLKEFSRGKRELLIFSISLVAALLWMTRPAFLWVPLTNLLCLLFLEYDRRTSRISAIKNAVITAVLASVTTVAISIPQYLITRKTTSTLDALFHTDGWASYHTIEASVYRYLTNLSGCGPEQLLFSPYSQTFEGVNPAHFHTSPVYRLVGFIARVVTGWDAVPTPLTYVYHLAIFPWVFLSAITGFLICAPLFLTWPQKDSSQKRGNKFRVAELGLIFTFLVSQLAVGITHGEFRYNVAGWIIAGLSILLLPQHFRTGFPWRKYLVSSLTVSLFVIVVGQLTLSLSQAWITCVK
jgi:hypothetical protein